MALHRSRSVLSVLIVLLYVWGWLCAWACPVALAEGEDDPLWNRPSFEKKVFRVAQRILSANGIPDRIEFLTSRLDIRNASARRFGGPNTVVIHKDMLDVMESDDELAAVLSHEIAHITKRHTGKIMPKRWAAKTALWTAYTVGGTAASVATAGLAAPVFIVGAAGIKKMNQSGIALTGPISRPYEKEADLVGLDYMVKAGYNPLAMESLILKGAGDSGPVANFFATHPGGTERLVYIHKAIQSQYPQYLADESVPATALDKGSHPEEGPLASAEKLKASGQSEISGVTATKDSQPAQKVDESQKLPQADLNQTSAQSKPKTDKPGDVHTEASQQPLAKQPDPSLSAKTKTVSSTAQTVASTQLSAEPASVVPSVAPTAKALLAKSLPAPTGQAQGEQSVARVLLSLQPDQLRILRMVSQHGYLSRQELLTQMEYVPSESLTRQINELIQKRLVRLLGAEPDEVIVLSDWASEAFSPERVDK